MRQTDFADVEVNDELIFINRHHKDVMYELVTIVEKKNALYALVRSFDNVRNAFVTFVTHFGNLDYTPNVLFQDTNAEFSTERPQ